MSLNKVKTNVYLDPKQLASLKRISAQTHIPMATLIRLGIDKIIAEYLKK